MNRPKITDYATNPDIKNGNQADLINNAANEFLDYTIDLGKYCDELENKIIDLNKRIDMYANDNIIVKIAELQTKVKELEKATWEIGWLKEENKELKELADNMERQLYWQNGYDIDTHKEIKKKN